MVLADLLTRGIMKLSDDSMVVDCMFWHHEYWCSNNRHLKAMTLYLREVRPERKRSEEMAQVRVWPLSPYLFLEGGQPVMSKPRDDTSV